MHLRPMSFKLMFSAHRFSCFNLSSVAEITHINRKKPNRIYRKSSVECSNLQAMPHLIPTTQEM
ncbi:unnamed protein product [Larinioides sclopetarius]|uniref:Uncharacterized protein n=1 Tax=Larinioides sclopetarius TaxID=280406 RepID=A0AAV2BM25_9ARAC